MAESVDVMVVTAHPDDAEFGVAGTVARWVREGKQVIYVVCTNGDKGTSDRSLRPEQLAEIREKEQRAAAKVLGVREVIFLGYPDQGLEDTPEYRKQIVRLIRIYRPKIVGASCSSLMLWSRRKPSRRHRGRHRWRNHATRTQSQSCCSKRSAHSR